MNFSKSKGLDIIKLPSTHLELLGDLVVLLVRLLRLGPHVLQVVLQLGHPLLVLDHGVYAILILAAPHLRSLTQEINHNHNFGFTPAALLSNENNNNNIVVNSNNIVVTKNYNSNIVVENDNNILLIPTASLSN